MRDPLRAETSESDAPPAPGLHLEAKDLVLIAMGAIPGALLRWQLQNDLVSNLIGCLVLGAITARHPPPPPLMLLGGIGFSGSLTTFSAWMLQLARLQQVSGPLVAFGTAIAHLAAGVALVAVGGVIAGGLRTLPSRWLRFRR